MEAEAENGLAQEIPEDVAPREPLIEIPACDWDVVEAFESRLGLNPLVAQTLARRGAVTDADVNLRIGEGEINPPESLPGASAAAQAIARHVKGGRRIVVHGDYDVDGVCSTAIFVRALVALGADVTWHVPSRFDDGYGLTLASVERMAAAGADLILAVDCGVGSIAEVARAHELGVAVVVCDHHAPGEELPDCPLAHPALGSYPDPELCATAVAHKVAALVTESLGGAGASLKEDEALVGLATVCDMMPLRGENRALVRRGVEAMRLTQRPGLCELIAVAGLDQLRVDAGSFGFALGPRINAAGRMHSAEPAVELLLTENRRRASELARGLGAANQKRREIEQQTLQQAEIQARAQRDRYALVVAAEGWHPGVLGIVAGRLADRYHRPVLALALADGLAAGSGRSGGRYDLLAGLSHCSDLLIRFGGHRAAAGLELDEGSLAVLRERFAAHAAENLTADDLRPHLVVDAVSRPADVNLETIAAIESLGPFGTGNPVPKILLGGVRLESVASIGRGGGHFKLGVSGEGARATVVAFRQERTIPAGDLPREVDLVVDLQRNVFNGREEAQAVLRGMSEGSLDHAALWFEEFERALFDEPPRRGTGVGEAKRLVDRRGDPLAALILEYQARSERLAVVSNDPLPLRRSLTGLLTAAGATSVVVLAYDDPRLATGGFDHVLLAEPPPVEEFGVVDGATTVAAWGQGALAEVTRRAADLLLTREHTVAAFRVVRDSQGPMGELIQPLRNAVPDARVAGRAVRTLAEIDVVRIEGSPQSVDAVIAVESGSKDLDQSFIFRSYSEYREESERWLRQLGAEQNLS